MYNADIQKKYMDFQGTFCGKSTEDLESGQKESKLLCNYEERNMQKLHWIQKEEMRNIIYDARRGKQ